MEAQLSSSVPVCSAAVTVTISPPPLTVTVYTSTVSAGLSSTDDSYSPSVGVSSLPTSSSLDGIATGLPSGSLSLSTSSQLTAISTVLPTGTFSHGSLSISTSLPSVGPSSSSVLSTGTPSSGSLGVSTSLPSGGLSLSSSLSTGNLSSSSLSISASLPSIDVSPSSASPIITVPSTSAPSLVGQSTSSSTLSVNLPSTSLSLSNSGASASLPTVSLSGSTISLGLSTSVGLSLSLSSGASASLPDVPLSGSTISLGLSTSTSSLSITSASLSASTLQLSSSSNGLSESATLPAVSLTSGLTISISSSVTLSPGSLTLSPTLPTLSISGSLSDLSISVATSTGLSTLPSSVPAVTSLPSTSLSLSGTSGLPTLSLPSTSTAGSIPTPNVLSTVYCPADDGLIYLSPDNRPFEIACSKRRLGNLLPEVLASNIEACTDVCGERSDCQSVSYRPADGTCLLYSDVGSEIPDGDWKSASTTDLFCPGADNSQYMDDSGSFYQVLCDYSFPDSYNITTSPGRYYLDCSSQCSDILYCSGFAYTDGVCTFTTGLGALSGGIRRNGTNTVVLVSKRAVKVGPDNLPFVSATTFVTNPRTSLSAPLGSVTTLTGPLSTLLGSMTTLPGSLTTLLPGPSDISSLSGTSLSQITLDTGLPSSLSDLPSSLGLTSPGSIDASITNTLPTQSSLPTLSISNGGVSGPSSLLSSVSAITGPSLTSTPDVGVSGLLSLLSSLPTITAPSLTSVSLSSAALPTSQGPSQTAVSYTCPEFDGQIILENGLSYVLNCNSIADGTPYALFAASSSFNDCFKACDQSSTGGGAKYCTAFTYEGAERGAGPGTCYLFNDVGMSFLPANCKQAITAIKTVNYVASHIVNGVSSVLSSLLPGGTLSSTLPATTLIPSLPISLPSGLVTRTTSAGSSYPTCDANTIALCIGLDGNIVVGPSSSPILDVGVSLTLPVGVEIGPSGVSVGILPSLSVGIDLPILPSVVVDIDVPIVIDLPPLFPPSKPKTSSSVPALATTKPGTTTVFTTSTVTSCMTGSSGTLTCPMGGLFTTLPSTTGAVTSISTSTSTSTSTITQTSVSVSISVVVSYVTVTAPATSSSTASTLSTVTSSSTKAPCKGVIVAGLCVL